MGRRFLCRRLPAVASVERICAGKLHGWEAKQAGPRRAADAVKLRLEQRLPVPSVATLPLKKSGPLREAFLSR